MYTKEELIARFPWTADPLISAWVESFTAERWEMIHKSTLPAQIETQVLHGDLITGFFSALQGIPEQEGLKQLLLKEPQHFKTFVEKLVGDFCSPEGHIQKMRRAHNWLGPQLQHLMEIRAQQSTDYMTAMDELVEIFSSHNITNLLEGNPQTLQALDSIPPELARFEGKDARQLCLDGAINFDDILAVADIFSPKIARLFPAWIGSTESVRVQANQFSDGQLNVLERWLAPCFKANDQLKIDLLSAILRTTLSKGEQKIHLLTNPVNFKKLIFQLQNEVFKTRVATTFQIYQMVLQQSTNVISLTDKDGLPFSGTPEQRKLLVENRLRKAVAGGDFHLALMLAAQENVDINSCVDGKTVLHIAAEYANHTGDTLCYEALLKHPQINPAIKNTENRTAAETLKDASFISQEAKDKSTFQYRLLAIKYGRKISPSLKCPISCEIMNDPVTISTGQTYDRQSLEEWALNEADPRTKQLPELLTCPVTRKLFRAEELNNGTAIIIKQFIEKFVSAKEIEAKAGKDTLNRLLFKRSKSFESFFSREQQTDLLAQDDERSYSNRR